MDHNDRMRPRLSTTPQLWQTNGANSRLAASSLLAPQQFKNGDLSSPEALQRILLSTTSPFMNSPVVQSRDERAGEATNALTPPANVIRIPRLIVEVNCPTAFRNISKRAQERANEVPQRVIDLANKYPLPPNSKKLFAMQFTQKNPPLQSIKEAQRATIIDKQWQQLPQKEKMRFQNQAHAYLLEFRKKHKNHREIEEAHEILARASSNYSLRARPPKAVDREVEEGDGMNEQFAVRVEEAPEEENEKEREEKGREKDHKAVAEDVTQHSDPAAQQPRRRGRRKKSEVVEVSSDEEFSLSESLESPRRGKKRTRGSGRGSRGRGGRRQSKISSTRKKAKVTSTTPSVDESVSADAETAISIPMLSMDSTHKLTDSYVRNLWASAFALNAAASLHAQHFNHEIRHDPERRDYGKKEFEENEAIDFESSEANLSGECEGGGSLQNVTVEAEQALQPFIPDTMDIPS